MDRLQRKNHPTADERCCGWTQHEVDTCCMEDAEARESGVEESGCNSSTSDSGKKSTTCCN